MNTLNYFEDSVIYFEEVRYIDFVDRSAINKDFAFFIKATVNNAEILQ